MVSPRSNNFAYDVCTHSFTLRHLDQARADFAVIGHEIDFMKAQLDRIPCESNWLRPWQRHSAPSPDAPEQHDGVKFAADHANRGGKRTYFCLRFASSWLVGWTPLAACPRVEGHHLS